MKAIFLRIALAAAALAPLCARATWQDDIGYTRLVAELGAALPTGAGTGVSHVEAFATAGGEYVPTTDATPSTGNFAGKTFAFLSGTSAVSGHAVRVGSFIYGANTNAALGDASVAPQAGVGPGIDLYSADGWLDADFLRTGLQLPRTETNDVSNHSWISYTDATFTPAEANAILRRVDYGIERDDYLLFGGLNNGSGTAVPELLASAYNAISVGLTNGNHSTGATPATVDGGGRTKPELVVPTDKTSWATGIASSCAALLHSTALPMGGNGTRCEVLRAVLLAGARKDPFPAWSNTPMQPLDAHFGAGEVNVWRSHRVLTAGPFSGGTAAPVGLKGWSYATLNAGAQSVHAFTVPAGCVVTELSAALVWNRKVITGNPNAWTSPTPELADLDLRLFAASGFTPGVELAASASASHPLEHVWLRNLPAGDYVLRVENTGTPAAATDYGLAWFTEVRPVQPPEIASLFQENTLVLNFSALCPGLTYRLEASADLVAWTPQTTFTATAATATWSTTPTAQRQFYRLVWLP